MDIGKSEAFFSVRGLRKTFDDLVAVDSLSFEVDEGEVFGFLGPNGAGKTTTLNMVCGLMRSDAGETFIDGISIADDYRSFKRNIGLCPQELVIWDSLTCLEQLEFAAQMYDVAKSLISRRSAEVLGELGLERWKHCRAKTLSGGLKRRLNIALALIHDPKIVILDEPQAGLDPQSRILVREKIRSLAQHKTVIITSHDMDEVDRVADRVAIIDHGRLLVTDTPPALKKRIGEGSILEIKTGESRQREIEHLSRRLPEGISHVEYKEKTWYLRGVDIPKALPAILGSLTHNTTQIEDILIRPITLEDVFIRLTGRGLRE
jgi:ABC-2 type transport system ATP-binding protein